MAGGSLSPARDVIDPVHTRSQVMNAQPLRIGWVGVGAMGAPMCANLLKAGYRVTVFDHQAVRADAMRNAGAEVADSLHALTAHAEIVFSMIFDDDGLLDVVLGTDGVAACSRPETVFIDMSTVSPAASASVAPALAERSIAYLRAPVSGAVPLAASAKLSTFVSGPRDVFERVLPVLECITAKQTWVGEAEQARAIKLAINLLLYMNTATLGEALEFGAQAGVDRDTLVDAINDSVVGSTHYRTKADQIKRRDYAPVGPISLAIKDLELAAKVALSNDVAIPLSQFVQQTLSRMAQRGLVQLDVAALADSRTLLQADSIVAMPATASHGVASQP